MSHSSRTENGPQYDLSQRDLPSTQQWRAPSAPNLALLERLAKIQNASLLLAAAIAGVVLCGWLIPAGDTILSRYWGYWSLMKANTALLTLLCVLSLALSKTPRLPSASRGRFVSQLCAAIVLLVSAVVIVEYVGGISTGIDTLLAADAASPIPGKMSAQTALAFVLLGPILMLLRVTRRAASLAVDLLVFCLFPVMLVIVSGYAFGALWFFGISTSTRVAPQTLVVLILICTVVFSRRAERGFYSVLTGTGIGSRISRFAAPLAIALPFVLETARFRLAQSGIMGRPYATASMTALFAVMGFLLVLVLSWHIDRQEQEIRNLSLRDDMTRLYNRRGFFLLAEREMRLARRSRVPFSVIFLDLDGLKHVNDTLGHDAGSDFLKEMAGLLTRCFRDSDVIARIGGDEFVVAFVAGEPEVQKCLMRIQRTAAERNEESGHPYVLSYSIGAATLDASDTDCDAKTLEALIRRADEFMYLDKQSKR